MVTAPEVGQHQEGSGSATQATIAIDPLSFFHYAAMHADRWRELLGRCIEHCTFGPGIIKKIEGEYLSIDLSARQGKKQLTEFGFDAFRRGFFRNLQIDAALREKMQAAAAMAALAPNPATLEPQASPEPLPKKRKSSKATKK
ncbi:MAG: hypothetical protein ACUVRZ_09315, partial [Desulfobacca sp.]|uniref:hypothetical protein n=1 Tax=Desulfobacca sp. TaxID=2067990 RepID=UPI00404A6BAC